MVGASNGIWPILVHQFINNDHYQTPIAKPFAILVKLTTAANEHPKEWAFIG